jgi:UPF0755 protein
MKQTVWILACLCILTLAFSFYFLYIKSPNDFPTRTIITVEEKTGLSSIANDLYQKKVISSPFVFRMIVILSSGEGKLQAGDYFFKNKTNAFGVATRLSNGIFGLTPVKVTLTEGMTTEQMSLALAQNLTNFNEKEFIDLAKKSEGYNFPDTYLFLPNTKPKEVISIMKENFDKKIATIDDQIKKFGRPVKDVITMASILEAEARTTETRKIISGILWKRMEIGMPLQVDAPFQYIIGKNTFQLTTNDLKFDSPYNTYKYKGLPPGPIGNPGLDAISATVNPIKTNYLYYLSDVRGNMHYAKTFAEHVINKEKYLK